MQFEPAIPEDGDFGAGPSAASSDSLLQELEIEFSEKVGQMRELADRLALRLKSNFQTEMIRLPNIKFDKVVKRSPRLGDSQFFLSEDTHNVIESCVRVMHAQQQEQELGEGITPVGE